MELNEYINQQNPARFPRVLLKEKEYRIASSYTCGGEKRKSVFINHESDLVSGIEYCLIGTRFYTTDKDGNPKSMSVFYIKSV